MWTWIIFYKVVIKPFKKFWIVVGASFASEFAMNCIEKIIADL